MKAQKSQNGGLRTFVKTSGFSIGSLTWGSVSLRVPALIDSSVPAQFAIVAFACCILEPKRE